MFLSDVHELISKLVLISFSFQLVYAHLSLHAIFFLVFTVHHLIVEKLSPHQIIQIEISHPQIIIRFDLIVLQIKLPTILQHLGIIVFRILVFLQIHETLAQPFVRLQQKVRLLSLLRQSFALFENIDTLSNIEIQILQLYFAQLLIEIQLYDVKPQLLTLFANIRHLLNNTVLPDRRNITDQRPKNISFQYPVTIHDTKSSLCFSVFVLFLKNPIDLSFYIVHNKLILLIILNKVVHILRLLILLELIVSMNTM